MVDGGASWSIDQKYSVDIVNVIAFISQNKNRLTSFRRKFFVSGHFKPVFKTINTDAPDIQLV
jgi:hypothetical protein